MPPNQTHSRFSIYLLINISLFAFRFGVSLFAEQAVFCSDFLSVSSTLAAVFGCLSSVLHPKTRRTSISSAISGNPKALCTSSAAGWSESGASHGTGMGKANKRPIVLQNSRKYIVLALCSPRPRSRCTMFIENRLISFRVYYDEIYVEHNDLFLFSPLINSILFRKKNVSSAQNIRSRPRCDKEKSFHSVRRRNS